ncbi:MAG: transcriptional regulator [Hyphomicrobiales bacterium]|nr:MAG: transcriptional regulator [Hyphomicrobiales bacterium]
MSSAEQGAFRALADPTRRQILMHLSQQDMTIAQVSERFDMTRGAVRKHLGILEEGHLISVQVQGRERVNRLEPSGMKSATKWLSYFSQFWDDKLGALGTAIEAENKLSKDNEND